MDIYKYDDFRLFLRDCFESRKRQDPSFSHRQFARAVGIKNPGYLLDVTKGKRRLSERVLEGALQIFGLKGAPAEFLRLLVAYGQAGTDQERETLYREILNRRAHSNFVRLNSAQVRYYEDTLYPLLVAAVEVFDFRGNYDALASFLDPPAPTAKVKKAIRDLCEWGLLRQGSDGRYVVVNRFLEPPETLRDPVRRMNREWLSQVPEALTRYSAADRHISTIILSVSARAKRKIMDRIEHFRRDVLEISQADGDPRQVLQLSMSFFPKSKELP